MQPSEDIKGTRICHWENHCTRLCDVKPDKTRTKRETGKSKEKLASEVQMRLEVTWLVNVISGDRFTLSGHGEGLFGV